MIFLKLINDQLIDDDNGDFHDCCLVGLGRREDFKSVFSSVSHYRT